LRANIPLTPPSKGESASNTHGNSDYSTNVYAMVIVILSNPNLNPPLKAGPTSHSGGGHRDVNNGYTVILLFLVQKTHNS